MQTRNTSSEKKKKENWSEKIQCISYSQNLLGYRYLYSSFGGCCLNCFVFSCKMEGGYFQVWVIFYFYPFKNHYDLDLLSYTGITSEILDMVMKICMHFTISRVCSCLWIIRYICNSEYHVYPLFSNILRFFMHLCLVLYFR